jgi:hypothetical protein
LHVDAAGSPGQPGGFLLGPHVDHVCLSGGVEVRQCGSRGFGDGRGHGGVLLVTKPRLGALKAALS